MTVVRQAVQKQINHTRLYVQNQPAAPSDLDALGYWLWADINGSGYVILEELIDRAVALSGADWPTIQKTLVALERDGWISGEVVAL